MIIKLFSSRWGRLRVLAFLEGSSLLFLLLIAVPLKHVNNNPFWTQTIGPVHGALFLLFLLNTLAVATEHKWRLKFTLGVLASCFIPFGTFYVDFKFFRMKWKEDYKKQFKS